LDPGDGKEWEQHEGVQLDAPVTEYRATLNERITRRPATETTLTDWPEQPRDSVL
jgi:hypothetical protein